MSGDVNSIPFHNHISFWFHSIMYVVLSSLMKLHICWVITYNKPPYLYLGLHGY